MFPYEEDVFHTCLLLAVSALLYHTIPYCTIQYYTMSHHTVLDHVVPYRTVLYLIILYHTVHTVPYLIILHHTIQFHIPPPHGQDQRMGSHCLVRTKGAYRGLDREQANRQK